MKKTTAIICHNLNHFQNWAIERRIRPIKGSSRWVDSDLEEYIPLSLSDFNSKHKLNGIRITDFEDITFDYERNRDEIINYCKSRIYISNRADNYMSLKKSVVETNKNQKQ